MTHDDWLVLGGFAGACLLTAASGAFGHPMAWYLKLRKPDWQPQAWVFPVVWTILYGKIAVSGWLVWRAVGFSGAVGAFLIYFVQIVLNGLWSGLFFGAKRMALALAELVVLWLAILANIIAFWPISATAALLLVPYLAWVGFAGVLNWQLVRLNPRDA